MSDRPICPPDHKHGRTTTCYANHRCGCSDCGESWRLHFLHVRKMRAYGRWVENRVPAGPVIDHVMKLTSEGMSVQAIARAASVDAGTVYFIVRGRGADGRRPKHLTRRVAEALLATQLTLGVDADRGLYPARGIHRRIQALTARGWSQGELSRRLGLSRQRVTQMLEQPLSTAAAHRRIAALYDELWDKQPSRDTPQQKRAFTMAIRRAERHHWVPPLAWDDIDTDDSPNLASDSNRSIDEIAIELAISGERVHLNPAERRIVVARLHPRKWSDALIAGHADCDTRTVERIRDELGLEAFDQTELIRRTAA